MRQKEPAFSFFLRPSPGILYSMALQTRSQAARDFNQLVRTWGYWVGLTVVSPGMFVTVR
jgi:hypothetical protein